MRTITGSAALACTAGAALALSLVAGQATAASSARITLENVRFTPKTVQVQRGGRVTWIWKDGSTPHNVASRGSRRFKSSSVKTRGTHVVRFTKAGTYSYICTIHPGMTGKVIIR